MPSKAQSRSLAAKEHSPLEEMLERPATKGQTMPPEQSALHLGELVEVSPELKVIFSPGGYEQTVIAASLVPLDANHIGQTVVLSPLAGGQGYVILGLLQPSHPLTSNAQSVTINDRKVEIAAEEELILRCGDASIRIDQTGAITVKGKTLLSRAEGTNRVQGGAVQIN